MTNGAADLHPGDHDAARTSGDPPGNPGDADQASSIGSRQPPRLTGIGLRARGRAPGSGRAPGGPAGRSRTAAPGPWAPVPDHQRTPSARRSVARRSKANLAGERDRAGAVHQRARRSGASKASRGYADSRDTLSPRNSRMSTPYFHGPPSWRSRSSTTQRWPPPRTRRPRTAPPTAGTPARRPRGRSHARRPRRSRRSRSGAAALPGPPPRPWSATLLAVGTSPVDALARDDATSAGQTKTAATPARIRLSPGTPPAAG